MQSKTVRKIPEILSRERLVELTNCFSQLKIGVIGDFALDAYWTVDMTRSQLSRETPQFPRPVVDEAYSPGAGGNVAQNLAALGLLQVSAFSVFGEDGWGSLLREALKRSGIDTTGIFTRTDRRTSAYIKPILVGYDSRQEDARFDFINTSSLAKESEQHLLTLLEGRLDELDALLITDQLETNGIITPALRQRLVALAGMHSRIQFLVDSRQWIEAYHGMVRKPNRMEALAAALPGYAARQAGDEAVLEAGLKLSAQGSHPVFVTLGKDGVLVCESGSLTTIPAAPVNPPLDVVGAGDTFFAALAAALASGGTPLEAGALANLAAAVTVEKLSQTGTAAPQEILLRYEMAASLG